jgi:tripartite-type tricarboxylate transporter receptor subunit TctC
VEFVIPAGTGGGADIMARFVAGVIQKNNLAPVNFLAVNKAGGAGAEAFLYMKDQKGNPNVLVITLSNLFTTPLAQGTPFNWRDLTPVSMLALDYFILWVNAETPYKTPMEYINAVKAKPGDMVMGGTGAKQEDQILTVQLEQAFGIKFIYLPLKGGGEVCTNLVGKHINSSVNNPSECVGHWKGGRVRPLAVLDSQRINFPDWDKIPTMKEATGKNVSYLMLRGIFTAPGVSKEVHDYYVGLMKKVTETDDWKRYLSDNALKGQFMSGPEYVKWLEEAEKLHKDLMTKGDLLLKK